MEGAMRNRGVEIYMLDEKERGQRNDLDVKTLVSREGLRNASHIAVLLNLHDFISDLILGEKPNANELLRAAALISQRLRHGTDERRAFVDIMAEVYYKTRSPMEFGCNDFRAVVATEIGKWLDRDATELFRDDVTLKTDGLRISSGLERIKQQATPLRQLAQLSGVIDSRIKYLLIHFYSISSHEDLRMRARYFGDLLSRDGAQHLLAVSESLCEFVENFPINFKEFPADCRWIPETNFPGKSHFASNRLVLGLHITASLKKEHFDIAAKEREMSHQVSLLDYVLRRRQKKIDDLFDDVLVEKFLDVIRAYDDFLMETVRNNIDLSDESVIKILELMTWRFIFHRCALVNIKKIDAAERHLILTNLKVHYRWFVKYSIDKVKSLINKQLPKNLGNIIVEVNASLEEQFSRLHQFGRGFQKLNSKPPPKVSIAEIELATALQKKLKNFDTSMNDRASHSKLVNLRAEEGSIESKIDSLKSLDVQEVKMGKYEAELLPLVDYFARLQLKKSLFSDAEKSWQDIKPCLILPVDLASSLSYYNKTRDGRFLHEVMTAFYNYLTRSSGVTSEFSPLLTHHLTNLLVSDESAAIITFGNFKELMKQHRRLNLTLWRNLQQLHDDSYDYLSSERRFVAKSFELFIQTLARTLNVRERELDQLIKVCLQRLSLLQENDDLSNSFFKRFGNCVANYSKLNVAEDFDESLSLVYSMYMELSYTKAILNSRLPLIDPSAKKALKKKYCRESVSNFEDLRDSFRALNEVYSGNDRTLHSHHEPVEDMIKTLMVKNERLGSYVAVRPKDVLYNEVVKAVNHGFATILSWQYVDRIILSLDKSIKDLIRADSSFCPKDSTEILKQYESAVTSFENLIREWSKYTPSYPDVIEPLLANVSEFLYGFKSNLALLRKLLLGHGCKKFDVQQELVTLVQMPSLGPDHVRYEFSMESCSNPKLHNFINNALGDDPRVRKQAILRLLKCGVQESFNNCVMEARSTGILNFSHFENFIKAFVSSWNEQEKNRELEQKEADALYKIKTKCDDKSETEQIEDELKELFPNYHDQDFADMRKATNLSDDPSPQSADNEFAGVISNDDVKFVIDLHLMLLQSFTKTEWLNPEKNKNAAPNFVHPLVEKYKIFRQICDKVVQSLDYRMDKELMESTSVLLSFVQNCGETSSLIEHSSPMRISHSKRADFYKDSNVEEVKASFHLLG
ncbi:hypothetical protein BDFB_010518, partial [Asbolus verrucosus]